MSESVDLLRPKELDDPALTEMLTSRFVVYGDERAMRVYHWFGQFEDNCRFLARRSKPKMLDLWQQTLMLQAFPYLPGNSHDYSHEGETLEQWSQGYSLEYRMLLGAQSVRTAKVALDAVLGGYYTQSLSMCRTLYESYKRMVYARVRPNEIYRWLSEDMIDEQVKRMEGYHRPSNPPTAADWKNLFPDNGIANDRASQVHVQLLGMAQNHMEYLNHHAHPDLEGATDLMNQANGELDRDRLNLAPTFSEMHLERVMHVDCSALSMLLIETSQYEALPSWWRENHEDCMRRFAVLFTPNAQ